MIGSKNLKFRNILSALFATLLFGAGASVATAQEVSFENDIMPILEVRCGECHDAGGAGLIASGLDLSSYEGIMAGGKFGPMVIPGNWMESNLLAVIEHRTAPEMWMPHNRGKLSKCETLQLRFWVLQGAKDN